MSNEIKLDKFDKVVIDLGTVLNVICKAVRKYGYCNVQVNTGLWVEYIIRIRPNSNIDSCERDLKLALSIVYPEYHECNGVKRKTWEIERQKNDALNRTLLVSFEYGVSELDAKM